MRVFILGAGVSKSYGGPLTKDLLTEAMQRVRGRSGYVRITKVINELLGYAFPMYNPQECIYPDIETVLSNLEVWKEFNSSIQREPRYSDFRIEEVRRLILRVVTERLIPLSEGINRDSAICRFAACLREGDVVITFNYDLGLEKALEVMETLDWDYFWRPRMRNRIALLKAHGSIDWFATGDLYQIPKREYESLDTNIGRISVLLWWDYTGIIPRRAKQITPYIIPPTRVKSFIDEEMRNIWRNINVTLARAANIYVFGYSLPEEDPQAQIILRSSIELNMNKRDSNDNDVLVVVDPEPRVKLRFDQLGFKYRFIPSRFETVDFANLLL